MPYHINPITGNPGNCKASKGQCPYGSLDEHYASEDEAREAFERLMEGRKSLTLNERFNSFMAEQKSDSMKEKWVRVGTAGVAFRIWDEEERALGEALSRELYEKVSPLALGPRQNYALDCLSSAHTKMSKSYRTEPFDAEYAIAKMNAAKRAIGPSNPSAQETIGATVKKLKQLTGREYTPKKGAKVEVTDEYGQVREFTFVKQKTVRGDTQSRKDWGNGADRVYAVVKNSQGTEITVPYGLMAEK